MVHVHSVDSSALVAKAKPDVKINDAVVDFRGQNLQQVDAAEVADVQKAPSPLPAEDLSKTLDALFSQFDADGSNSVSRKELLAGLQAIGFSPEGSEAVAEIVFAQTTDVDGNSEISRSELDRTKKVGNGDSFAFADLNNDNTINEKELADAVDRYSKIGKVNREFVFNVFRESDADNDGILTRAEFEVAERRVSDALAAPAPAPAPEPVSVSAPAAVAPETVEASAPRDVDAQAFQQIFGALDADQDGQVTDAELDGLKQFGFSGKDVDQIRAFLAARGTDTNQDGAISRAELNRQLAKDKGDVFGFFDADQDGNVTQQEVAEGAAALGHGDKIAKGFVESAALFDEDSNGIISRAEFDSAMAKLALAKKPADDAVPIVENARRPVNAPAAAPVGPRPLDINEHTFNQVFSVLDADGNNEVSDAELDGLRTQFGFTAEGVDQIRGMLAARGIDSNQNGSISRAELNRQLARDAGDAFGFFDADQDGNVTQTEVAEGAFALGHDSKIAKGFVQASSFFDGDKDGIISKAEFDEVMKKAALSKVVEDATPSFKIKLSDVAISPAVFDAQLAALLKDKA